MTPQKLREAIIRFGKTPSDVSRETGVTIQTVRNGLAGRWPINPRIEIWALWQETKAEIMATMQRMDAALMCGEVCERMRDD